MGLLVESITTNDERARRWIHHWIKEAGGKISREVLERKYEEHFRCKPCFITDEDLIRKNDSVFKAFAFDGENVSCRH